MSFVGIDPSDIRLYTDTSGTLHIESISDPSNTIAVYAGTTGTGTYESTIGSYVQQITFDDEAHTTWDLTGGLTLTGSDSNDSSSAQPMGIPLRAEPGTTTSTAIAATTR